MSTLWGFMSNGKPRSSGGCWTCRLRRKKCAENRPECDTCRALEITCFFQDDKPEWMDGGRRQRQMAEAIKAQVKRQASQRRDRRYLDMMHARPSTVSGGEGSAAAEHGGNLTGSHSHAGSHSRASSPSRNKTLSASPPPGSTQALPSDATSSWGGQLPIRARENEVLRDPDCDSNTHLVIIYFDFVFPYLFPFYRPPALAGGRGWILDVLQSNRPLFHSAISLATSFVAILRGVTLEGKESQQDYCFFRMMRKLDAQLELGLTELQKEVRTLNAAGAAFDCAKGLAVMQSVMQMLLFEVAMSDKENWRMHLDAAIALFVQIMPDASQWKPMLFKMHEHEWPPPQSPIRFFAATLLYVDVMSSITFGKEPRLQHYQEDVIPKYPAENPALELDFTGPVFVEEYFGLSNWILHTLSQVSALASWKRQQTQQGVLSVEELERRAQALATPIKNGIALLEPQLQRPRDGAQPMLRDPIEVGHVVGQETKTQCQLLWLLAMLSYLNVVTSGWQPNNAEIVWCVGRATDIFTLLPTQASWAMQLRAMAWPLCVCACLSPLEAQDTYRTLMAQLGPLKNFGIMKEVNDIMEKVWSMWPLLDQSWDVSKCLNVLGHGVLLV